MEELFVALLTKVSLWDVFIEEYGEDYKAPNDLKDGWFFGKTHISYRACKMFEDHREGRYWYFGKDDLLDYIILETLKGEGFKERHNGGDEEDQLLHLEYDPTK